MKECCGCGAVLPLDEFHNRKQSRDGKRAQCKLCVSIIMQERRKAGLIVDTPSRHEDIFKAKYGVSAGTVRCYVMRTYGDQFGELSQEQKEQYIAEYKDFRARKRKTKWYTPTIKPA